MESRVNGYGKDELNMKSVFIPGFLAALVLAIALPLSGCASNGPEEPSPDWPEPAEPVLLLQPGDNLQIKFAYWPELDEEQLIRPDGMIALQLIGEVKAQGSSPDQLREELLARYASKLKNPEIAVIVRSFDSRRVYVGGEVRTPGVVPLQGRMTAMQAIMAAGGFLKPSAKLAQVLVVRRRDDKQYAKLIDLRAPLETNQSQPFYLEPFDVVCIPPKNIDKVDQWVEQYVNRVIPRNVSFFFGYSKLYEEDSDFDTTVPPIQITPVP